MLALLSLSDKFAQLCRETMQSVMGPSPQNVLALEVVLSNGPGNMGEESAVLNVSDWSHWSSLVAATTYK